MAADIPSDTLSSEITEFVKVDAKAASAPIVPLSPETKVKTKISAPSYLFSLKENDAPPFRKPGKEDRPHLVIGTIMNDEEAIAMIAACDEDPVNGLIKFLGM